MADMCEHLRPIAALLLARGNMITGQTAAGFLAFQFRDLADFEELRSHVSPLPPFVRPRVGPKDRRDQGVICLQHGQVLAWPGIAPDPPALCAHLKPLVDFVLTRGNTVLREDVYAWSTIDLVLNFRDRVDLAELKRSVSIPATLQEWDCTDTHYELQHGFTCHRTSRTDEGGAQTKYSYDAADQMLQAGNVSYTYDGNGNMTGRSQGKRTTKFAYDAQDRLVTAELDQIPGVGGLSKGLCQTPGVAQRRQEVFRAVKTTEVLYFNSLSRPWTTVRNIFLLAGCEKEAAAGPSATGLYLLRFAEGQPESDRLKQALAREGIEWGLRRERSYSAKELESAPLLRLGVSTAPTGHAGPKYGTTFDLSTACPQCGTGAKQTSPLVLKASETPKKGHIFQTLSGEILISRELASELMQAGTSGVQFLPATSARDGSDLPWLQVRPTTELPAMAPTSKGILRENPCTRCGRDGYFHDAENPFEPVYRSADVAVAALPDVARTFEHFGNSVRRDSLGESHFAKPLLIVKPKVMLILKRLKVKGVEFDPIRVE